MAQAIKFDPCEVYRKSFSRIADMGHGLWRPSKGVDIGDVGYIDKGTFKPLFNVIKDGKKLKECDCGEPLQCPKDWATFTQAYLKPETYHSQSIKATSLSAGPGINVPGGPTVQIDLSYQHSNYEGALLYLPFCADRKEVAKAKAFIDYMFANFPSWQAYMEREGLNDPTRHPLSVLLVRGWIKAPQWAIAAFKSEGSTRSGTLKGGLYAIEGRVSWQFTDYDGLFKQSNYGPLSGPDAYRAGQNDELPVEECIFLSYYKIKYRLLRWAPKVIQAAAGPDELPPPDPADGADPEVLNGDYEIEAENPAVPEPRTDVDIILDYILEHAPDATAAVACDADLVELFPGGQDWPDRLDDYLEHNLPPITVTSDGVGSLSLEATILSKQRQRRMQQQHQEHNHGLDSKQRTATVIEQVTLPDGKNLQWLPVVLTDGAEDGSSIISCAISKDGSRIATATDNYVVHLWDRFTGQLIAPLEGHEDQVLTVAFSPSGERLISGSSDCKAIIWNLANAQPAVTLDRQTGAIWCCAYSPDGETIATGSFDETVCLWTTEGELKHSLGQHDAQVTHIAFSPDSKLLASCAENVAFIWNCETGVRQHRLEGHTASIWNMCFSHDGGRVVTCGDDATSRVWSADTGEELVTLQEHGGPVWGVGFSADDQEIASGSYDSTISVCNSFTGENKFTIRERPAQVNDLAYSKSGRYIATGDGEGLVKVWDASSGAFVAEFQGHEDNVKTIQWTPDDRALVSCSGDGTVRVWDFMDLMRML